MPSTRPASTSTSTTTAHSPNSPTTSIPQPRYKTLTDADDPMYYDPRPKPKPHAALALNGLPALQQRLARATACLQARANAVQWPRAAERTALARMLASEASPSECVLRLQDLGVQTGTEVEGRPAEVDQGRDQRERWARYLEARRMVRIEKGMSVDEFVRWEVAGFRARVVEAVERALEEVGEEGRELRVVNL